MTTAEQVTDTCNALVAAFGSHDPARYFRFFAADASFIFYTHSERLNSVSEYQQLWLEWERQDGFHVMDCKSTSQRVQMLGNDAAVFTHEVQTTVRTHDSVEQLRERETIVLHRTTGDDWVAVHEHLSPLHP